MVFDDAPKLCECGCGLPAPLATRTRSFWGHVKGKPIRFVHGHATGKHEIDPAKQASKDLQCRREYKRKMRERGREIVREYLSTHPCIECGNADPDTLDFDHRDPSTKIKSIADLVGISHATKERILLEIEKCDVRCANCHRKKHARERQGKLS